MESILQYRMAVVTPDKQLKRAIKRVTTATASTADFVDEPSRISSEPAADLVILDARNVLPSKKALARVPTKAHISYILDGDNLIPTVDLLLDDRVCSLLCHDETFDDDEFIASATKALRRDIFGLQKYFPWGVTTYSMVVRNYEQKTRAIEIVMEYARAAGLRGPVRDRIQLASDELMMNALYHAPMDEKGNELYGKLSRKEVAQLEEVMPIEVHYGCSGRYFGLSIRDTGGSLTRQKALEYLMKAKNANAQVETKTTGAGLGLISVLRSVSKLIFNLEPGVSTEVIALFDMNLIGRGKVGARSLHIFTAEWDDKDDATAAAEPSEEQAAKATPGPSRWTLATLLLALLVVALGIAYYMRVNQQGVTSSVQSTAPTITVIPTPADATIQVNGMTMSANTPIPVPDGAAAYEIVVTKPHHEMWKQTLTRAQLHGPVYLYVTLDPE